MKPRKKTIKHDPTLSGSMQGEDGIDPRYVVHEYVNSKNKPDRKGQQLCAQIRRALEYLIPESLQDTEQDAMVLDVQPVANTGHLLVLVQSVVKLDENGMRELESAILQRCGMLRTAVAQSIERRKVPSLTFRVVPK